MAQADQERKDEEFEREEDRKDARMKAELKRNFASRDVERITKLAETATGGF